MAIRVNIEVSVKLTSDANMSALETSISEELMGKSVYRGLLLRNFNSTLLANHVDAIRICEMVQNFTANPVDVTGTIVIDNDTLFRIFLYRLSEETPQSESIGGDDDTLAANFLPLPALCLEGLWESLVYDSTVKEELVQYSNAMLHYSKCKIDPNIINYNRILLLHGPPGTGKTSLCKALAHKLSLRLNSLYSQALLIEINTHSLFSKYFSESGKLVSKMFGKIRELAGDPNTLLCVLIDEIESLTHSRAASSHGSEPSDAIRVVNAVLTHLDILKNYPNVLTLTTSNVTNAIDIAFVDRADLRLFIPNPSPFGVYTILHSCIEELVKKGVINGPCPQQVIDKISFEKEESNGLELIALSRICVGLSGRALRKLPLRVHSTFIRPDESPDIETFAQAMTKAAILTKKEMMTLDGNATECK